MRSATARAPTRRSTITVPPRGRYGTTVITTVDDTVVDAKLPLLDAVAVTVMVAVPAATAVTTPVGDTVAMATSDDT